MPFPIGKGSRAALEGAAKEQGAKQESSEGARGGHRGSMGERRGSTGEQYRAVQAAASQSVKWRHQYRLGLLFSSDLSDTLDGHELCQELNFVCSLIWLLE